MGEPKIPDVLELLETLETIPIDELQRQYEAMRAEHLKIGRKVRRIASLIKARGMAGQPAPFRRKGRTRKDSAPLAGPVQTPPPMPVPMPIPQADAVPLEKIAYRLRLQPASAAAVAEDCRIDVALVVKLLRLHPDKFRCNGKSQLWENVRKGDE